MHVTGAGVTEIMGIMGQGAGDILGHKANVIWDLIPGTGLINNIADIFGHSINFKQWGGSIGRTMGEWFGGTVDKLFGRA